jgi:1,4-dihydroxy-2-naphthoate octaprenyltransferase
MRIPDFHQDRLVGKRNLVVRLGRARAVWLYVGAGAALALGGGAARSAAVFPPACLAYCSRRAADQKCAPRPRDLEHPRAFVAAIRDIVACYLVAVGLFTGGVLLQAWS